MPTSLVEFEIVAMTTFGATKVGIMTIVGFQDLWIQPMNVYY